MPPRINPVQAAPVRVSAYTATSAAGCGKAALLNAVRAHRSGLRPNSFSHTPLATWVGQVDGLDGPLPDALEHWDCRNNRLAWLGLQADSFADALRPPHTASARRGWRW